MLELAVLGLLKDSSMHGYELKKRLDEQLGHFRRISYGSLYPTLKRLSTSGAIEISETPGEVSRKRRNVYHLTPKGEALFAELLESGGDDVADRDSFMVRFAFSKHMPPEARRRLFERRRGYLQDRLTKMSASLKRMRDRMDAYSREVMQYGVTETEHDIRWLNDLLAAEGVAQLGKQEQASAAEGYEPDAVAGGEPTGMRRPRAPRRGRAAEGA